MMLHSMGDAGIGWKFRNATEWDEDVTQRVQKLYERIEPFFTGGDGFFQLTFLIPLHSLCFVLQIRYFPFTSATQPFSLFRL